MAENYLASNLAIIGWEKDLFSNIVYSKENVIALVYVVRKNRPLDDSFPQVDFGKTSCYGNRKKHVWQGLSGEIMRTTNKGMNMRRMK